MRKSLLISLGVLLVLFVGAGLVFASDSSPAQEPETSPFFEATLQQAVDELDGRAQLQGYNPPKETEEYTSNAFVWPQCGPPGWTWNLHQWPQCHFTTEPNNPACIEDWPTRDYTWDASIWKECGPDITQDIQNWWCDPNWTSDVVVPQCQPEYTMHPEDHPYCSPRYTKDPVQWPACVDPEYTDHPDRWDECAFEPTSDGVLWPRCHYTSNPVLPACNGDTPYPTQDYTSNSHQWPECAPGYTSTPNEPCNSARYTESGAAATWPWCDPAYTTNPLRWEQCHYTSDPNLAACQTAWPTKDYTWDHNLWSDCDPTGAGITKDTDSWWCSEGWTYDPALIFCDPYFTWFPNYLECEPRYTYDQSLDECAQYGPFTSSPNGWPECNLYTADARIWPECHYTSSPLAWDACGDTPPFPTKDYTTDPRVWDECQPGQPDNYTTDPQFPECHYTDDPQRWPECDPDQPQGDLGDAPDSTNHPGSNMTAFAPATLAHYPTVFDPATGLPQGPKHWAPKADAWLGKDVSVEYDADLLPDADTVLNIDPPADDPDDDKYDDGVDGPVPGGQCVPRKFTYTVTVASGAPTIDRYVNVWFDWNKDGDWADVFTCTLPNDAPEWAVRNDVHTVGPGTWVFETSTYLPYHPAGATLDATWMRISIADQPPPKAANGPPDGQGPRHGYKYGETEDYYMDFDCPLPVADFQWDPATICPTTTVYFWDTSTGSPTSWNWDFGDSSGTSTAQNPTYVFGAVGDYDVTLKVSNACGPSTKTKKVTVIDCPDQEEEYDIWVKDNPADDGSVPSSTPWYVGTDIWVRNADDNGTDNQNPIPGTTNYIYVRVRNRLTTTVEDITGSVYWANAALSTPWPAAWGYIDSFSVSSLAGGAETIKSIPWDTPYSNGHFCFRVRLDAPKDPVGSGPDTTANVDHPHNNNNIAQDNANVVPFTEVSGCGFYTDTEQTEEFYFDAFNAASEARSIDIVVDSSDFPLGTGTIELDPGDLWEAWTAIPGFTKGASTLTVDSLPATIQGANFAAGQTVRMTMTITAEIDDRFTVDVSQVEDSTTTGGIQYIRALPRCFYLPVIMKAETP